MKRRPHGLTPYRGERKLLAFCCMFALAAIVFFPPFGKFGLNWSSFLPIVQFSLIFLAFWPYTYWRGLSRFTVLLETLFLGLLLSLPILVISYAAMRTGMPMADDRLAIWDKAIGFHWPSFVRWVDGSPSLSMLLAKAYTSFAYQLLSIPLVLCLFNRAARAYRFICGYFLICSASCFTAIWFPAVGAYAYYQVPKEALANINAHFGYFFLESFAAVRNDPGFVLSVNSASGIITFPSIHAGIAVLCAWAMWGVPLLRYPFLALNAAMCLSAVSHGSHYFVDVLAGMATAGITIAAVNRLCRLARAGNDTVEEAVSFDAPAVPAAAV